jgi:hypothetical protein
METVQMVESSIILRKEIKPIKISGISQIGLTGQPYGGTLGVRASQLLSGKIKNLIIPSHWPMKEPAI